MAASAASLQMHLQHSPRKKNFGYEETIRLLELWTHYTNGGTHPELGKGHRTGRLWLVISERMKAMNYNRGPEECKVRVGNLRAKYTKLKRGYLAGDFPQIGARGEGVPDWPYYPVLAKFLEGRGDFGDSYDTGSHTYTEQEARPGASHHHPGMFLSMSMEEPNEPLVCNVDGGGRRGGAGSSRSNDDDSSVSMPDSGSSAGSEHDGGNSGALPPNGHMAGLAGSGLGASGLGGGHGGGMAGVLLSAGLGESGHGAAGLTAGQLKRRPTSPGDDPRRQSKRAKHGTSTMLLSLMQAMLKIEEEHLKLQQERAASEAAMMQAVTAFFSNMTQMFGGHLPTSFGPPTSGLNINKVDGQNNAAGQGSSGSGAAGQGGAGNSGSKTPSNPSSSCSNSPAYTHNYSNNPAAQQQMAAAGMNQKMHMDGNSYPYGGGSGGMSQPSPSPSGNSAGNPMASPASYPLSPAYQQGAPVNSGGGGWYNNGKGGGPASGVPMVVGHPFSNDILGIPKSRHDAM